MKIGARERFLREESGFTLTEVLVTAVIMVTIIFALYGIFDTGMRIFSFGNNEVEATENARLGLEKMEREIRQAPKVSASATPAQNHLFFTTAAPATALTVPPTTATQLTFGNDLNGDNSVTCGPTCEYITYKLTSTANPATTCIASTTPPCTLRRVNTANSGDIGDPVVENVAPNGLSFAFFKSDGTAPASEAEIGKVRVSLNVSVDKGIGNNGTQVLTTEIDLRNR